MKIVRVDKETLSVDLYRSRTDAAFDAGVSRFKLSRLMATGWADIRGYRYSYPYEK